MSRIEGTKTWVEIFQGLATIAAACAGGWWFWQQGLAKPRAKLDHKITHVQLSRDVILLVVDIEVENIGSTPFTLNCGKVRVWEMRPERDVGIFNVKQNECNVPVHDLAPNEIDNIHVEVDVPGDVTTVRVGSFFPTPGSKGDTHGWGVSTFYDIKEQRSLSK